MKTEKLMVWPSALAMGLTYWAFRYHAHDIVSWLGLHLS